jgi:hypothetical protein
VTQNSTNSEYLYLPKNPVFDLEYDKYGGSNGFVTFKVRLEWGKKRYQYFDPVTSLKRDFAMADCQNGHWGVILPNFVNNDSSPNSCDAATGTNLIVQDLGFGFY